MYLTAEVFSYLDADYKEELVGFLTGKDIKNIVEELFSDDIVDFPIPLLPLIHTISFALIVLIV